MNNFIEKSPGRVTNGQQRIRANAIFSTIFEQSRKNLLTLSIRARESPRVRTNKRGMKDYSIINH